MASSANASRSGMHVGFEKQSTRQYEYRERHPSTLTEFLKYDEYKLVPMESMPSAEHCRLEQVYVRFHAKTLFEEVYGPANEINPSPKSKAVSTSQRCAKSLDVGTDCVGIMTSSLRSLFGRSSLRKNSLTTYSVEM